MNPRVWVLVEWVDERQMLPSYGMVKLSYMGVSRGKMINIRLKSGEPSRRAEILRISDNKRNIEEYKDLLERQNLQMQNVLSICMRTVQELKSDHQRRGSSGSLSRFSVSQEVAETTSSSDSEDVASIEPEEPKPERQRGFNQYKRPFSACQDFSTNASRSSSPSAFHPKRRMISSTPVPNSKRDVLTFDQATQTDNTTDIREQIKEVEEHVNALYSDFMGLASRLMDRTADDTNESGDQSNNSADQSSVRSESVPSQSVRVRRVSAHTTNAADTPNNAEVADGDMYALGESTCVPARVYNSIDWSSYTTATRQLLQAIFPRKVLATHSLTGKQSPAFSNRPAKKILDPAIVRDIINTVSTRCNVNRRLVRHSITIKCTDEAKLYRNRQMYRQARENQENVPPSPPTRSIGSNESLLNEYE